MQAIILCGGLATRLGNISRKIPKVLLKVGGRAVLDWQLDLLAAAGVTEVILASGHLHTALFLRIGDTYRGMPLRYAREDKKLGTGGAIKNAMQFVDSSSFFVLNGDVLFQNLALRSLHQQLTPAMAGMLLGVHVDDVRPYGEIRFDAHHRITAFCEKPSQRRRGTINGGVYLFNRAIAAHFPAQEVFSLERDVFPRCKELFVFPTAVQWVDIGTPESFARAQRLFR